jgi:hypothetical protein
MTYAALIYSHSITPRLRYIVEFLSQYYGLPFGITSDEEKYLYATEPCQVNYSYRKLKQGEFFIHAHVLLTESYIRQVKTECYDQMPHGGGEAYKAFFKTEGDAGFDIFAATFFLLSRYEEYLPHRKDKYGRFAHEQSVAFQNDFLHLPLINIWLEDFRVLLADKNPAFGKHSKTFSFLPTYDIDMAWSFLHKGWRRNAGGIMLHILQLRFGRAARRMAVLRHKKADPYDAYEWMDGLHKQYGLRPVYFFLVAGENSKFDRNIDVRSTAFRQLVHDLASRYETGLHPSWSSGDLPALLRKEKLTLEHISDKTIVHSRQHYIRFQLPSTYRYLIGLGIRDDHSMGYGSINGFRASYAGSYFWYDLKEEAQTELMLHPFCFMDANAYYEQHFHPDEAYDELMSFADTIKKVKGTMITVWHNSFLGTGPEFNGWREAYAKFISNLGNC